MNQSLDSGNQGSKLHVEVLNDGLELGGFSCAELARFRVPGFPATEQGWGKVVAREDWPWKEIQAKGGRKGVKRIYMPPRPLLEVIRRHLLGDEVTKHEVAAARVRLSLNQTQAPGTLDENGNYIQRVQQLSALHDAGKATAQYQAAIAHGTVKVGGSSEASDAELLVALGIALTKATWLPSDTPPEQRMAIARAASRAICAITDSPANRTRIALNSDILDDALSLAWLVDPNRSK